MIVASTRCTPVKAKHGYSTIHCTHSYLARLRRNVHKGVYNLIWKPQGVRRLPAQYSMYEVQAQALRHWNGWIVATKENNTLLKMEWSK